MNSCFELRRNRWLPRAATAVAAALACLTAQGATAVDGEVLLKLRSTTALGTVLQRHGLSLKAAFGARPIYRVNVNPGVTVESALTTLSVDPDVLIAEQNTNQGAPESVRGSLPWAIGTPEAYAAQWAGAALNLSSAHAQANGSGVTVAVLDTGADFSHPALAGRLRAGWDFVDGDTDASEGGTSADPSWGHGTHVAGLVAMVAPGATIWPLRVLDANGEGNSWAIAEALLYAVDPDGNPATNDGAQVINLSLGTTTRTDWMRVMHNLVTCTAPEPGDLAGDLSDPGFNDDKVRCASASNPVVVAGAGNNANTKRFYPAAEGVYGLIAVAATNASGGLASFSNYGKWIGQAAPGEHMTSTMPGGLYGTWSGTSMATPIVSGTAALVRSMLPRMPAEDIRRCMENTGTRISGSEITQVNPSALLRSVARDPRGCR